MINNQSDIYNNFFFSIVVCCYNSEKFIDTTIKSVLDQRYNNWELVIVDDGSTDNTINIIKKKFGENKKIRIFNQKNKGLAVARNEAIKKSKHNWIVIIDHDDRLRVNRLDELKKIIIGNKGSKLIFSDAIFFDENKFLHTRFEISRDHDNFIPHKISLKKEDAFINLVQYGCFIVSSTVAFSKKEALEIGLFDNKYKFIVDYIFFLRFAKKYDFYCSDQILSEIRVHDNQSTNLLKKTYFIELNKLYFLFYFNKLITLKIKLKVVYKHMRLFYSYFIKNNNF